MKSYKTFNVMRNFACQYRYKKALRYNSDVDLYLTPFANIPQKYIIELMSNNTIYKFKITNLVNLWVECLNKIDGLYAKLISIKNPYTNLPFTEPQLYKIYFFHFTITLIYPKYLLNL